MFKYGEVDRNQIQKSEEVEFRPPKGKTHLRVLPPHPDSKRWFKKSFEHWVGDGHVVCPRQIGNACPICEKGEALYSKRTEDSIEAANEMRPREQYYYNVIVFNSPDEKVTPKSGVQVMRSGKKIHSHLVDLDEDFSGGWGDMTNPNKGFDITITRTGEGRNDTEYLVKGVPGSKPLKEALESYGVELDTLELKDLNSFVVVLSYEGIQTRLRNRRVAPGFPGGPRKVIVPQNEVSDGVVPQNEVSNLEYEGEVTLPPKIEEV